MSPDRPINRISERNSTHAETTQSVRFVEPYTVDVVTTQRPQPNPDEVLVETKTSAISAGTEGLIYRGEAPENLAADEQLPTLSGDLSYPLSYGYATVGEVLETGEQIDSAWIGTRVFAYHPHASHFTIPPSELLPIPDSISFEEATIFANMETAVSLLLDGRPTIGERVVVFGQGVVGLLSTALLAASPIESLVTVDNYQNRRDLSQRFGADTALRPDLDEITDHVQSAWESNADLVYELSGNPTALDDAIHCTRYSGRIIVGSWYGEKPTTVGLGGRFHRDRIEIRSSQVSTIDPVYRGRISQSRRHHITWNWLERLEVDELFTHRIPIADASDAYNLLDTNTDEAVQILLTYPEY